MDESEGCMSARAALSTRCLEAGLSLLLILTHMEGVPPGGRQYLGAASEPIGACFLP